MELAQRSLSSHIEVAVVVVVVIVLVEVGFPSAAPLGRSLPPRLPRIPLKCNYV